MAASRDDARLLLFATGMVVLAGLLVAAVLLLATGQGGSPTTYEPLDMGAVRDVERLLREGGPYYVADPFGGPRSIMFALEDGEVVALSTRLPGEKDCRVLWKDTVKRFVDCNGDRHRSTELARYLTAVDQRPQANDALLVDLRKKLPPPG